MADTAATPAGAVRTSCSVTTLFFVVAGDASFSPGALFGWAAIFAASFFTEALSLCMATPGQRGSQLERCAHSAAKT